MAELPEPLDVIAVGAHPDDVEIGVGGTLAMLVRQGFRVGIVDLTDGEPTPASPGPEVRMQEAAEAARILGVHVRETLPLPNRRLLDGFETRVALAKVFRRYRPQLVIGLSGATPLASPDHWQTGQIVDAAVFYSRLTKWDAEFDGLPVHTVPRQLWFRLGFYSLDIPQAAGHLVVDIGEVLSIKLEAIQAYATQFPAHKRKLFRTLEAQNRYYGSAAGFEAGELVLSPSTLGARNLMQAILLGDVRRESTAE